MVLVSSPDLPFSVLWPTVTASEPKVTGKTAALVRSMKVMAEGLEGGTSFMEDYTYHLDPGNTAVLGAHMLEVCPSIAEGKPSLQVHPLV